MTSRPCRDGGHVWWMWTTRSGPQRTGVLLGGVDSITRAFKIRCCRVMSFLSWTERVTSVCGEDTYMSQATLPDCSAVLKHCIGCLHRSLCFGRTFVSLKRKHVSKLAWGSWLSGGASWLVCPEALSPASLVLSPDWTSHGVSQGPAHKWSGGRR